MPSSESWQALDELVKTELAPDLRVIRPLGRGSVSSVYLAREAALDRMVAIKVLAPGKAADKTARRRFEREARSAARIAHPNVTSIYQVNRLSNELPYQVMEYVDGRNFEDVLAGGGPLPVDEGREVLRQLAAGLAAAHENGIIHRDVKPANLLREESTGRVVLTDFGVAAVRDTAGADTTRLTMQGQVLGDLQYVSPEHLMGEELTELADVYSLGVLGYKLLTGSGPYPGDSPAQLTLGHLKAVPTPLAQVCPGVDPVLANVLARCLAKKPEHRPRAADVVAALTGPPDAVQADLPPSSAFEAFFGEVKRRRVFRVAAGYLAIAAAAIGGLSDVFGQLNLPQSGAQVTIVLILAGFPLALTLTWVFDIRQGRLTRTSGTEHEAGPRLSRVLPIVALVASLGLAAFGVWWVLGR